MKQSRVTTTMNQFPKSIQTSPSPSISAEPRPHIGEEGMDGDEVGVGVGVMDWRTGDISDDIVDFPPRAAIILPCLLTMMMVVLLFTSSPPQPFTSSPPHCFTSSPSYLSPPHFLTSSPRIPHKLKICIKHVLLHFPPFYLTNFLFTHKVYKAKCVFVTVGAFATFQSMLKAKTL